MKILVAEDDLVTREILKRILTHMSDEILEANNGVEALEMIERHDPDFLFTDIQMPLLDGLAVVEAVRSSRTHSMLPIVCMSSVKDKDDITRLVSLGIADYILKPLRPGEVHERFRRVISQHAGWRQRQGAEGQTSLLVVDSDPNFRQFAIPLLEGDFVISQAISGAHALRVFQESELKPTTILVAEGLPMVSETQVVNLISKLSIESRTGIPSFWLVTDSELVPHEKARHFAGVIKRSFVPETFMAELRRTLLAGASPVDKLRRHLQEEAPKWMVTATRQTLGVMSGQDVTTLSSEGLTITDGISGRITLTGGDSRVEVVIACNRTDAERLAAKVLRRDATLESGGLDVFGELSNTIGGRARAALLERDFDLHISLPEISQRYNFDAAGRWDSSAWFSTANGDTFFVGLRAEEAGADLGGYDALAELEKASAPVGGGESADDALF
ncbi:MAG: response regulator [Gemmatimonadetes bacterium]|jgi:two-component system chemotaxis response regulator CheY|nr:response regulator [Gemmatimonadota bacterium]MBK9409858.1 response regulator [Gemmatimonadota bacterium]